MTASTVDLYPAPMQSFHGRSVWPLGEEGDWGTMVEGHGRRALAAYSAFLRDALGRNHGDGVTARGAKQVWVVFHETCGCTEEQHRTEHSDAYGADDCGCERHGLPPCRSDLYAWTYDRVAEGAPGALPVLEVQW